MHLSAPFRTFSSILGLCAFASISFASVSHTPLKKVEGFVIHSSTSVSTFNLDEGHYGECEQTNPSLNGRRCTLEGAQVTLTRDGGDQVTIPLTTLSYFESNLSGEIYHHYGYRGVWKVERDGRTLESDMLFNVIHIGDGTPSDVRGYLSISDLNITEQIRGRAQP